MTHKCLRLTAPIELAAPTQGGARRRFSGVAYSGGIAELGARVIIDLGSTKVAGGAVPILFQHRHDEAIGVGSVSNSGQAMTVEGELFSDMDERAAAVVGKADAGLPYQLSVGVFGISEKYIPEGAKAMVNGADHTGPLTILSGGMIREVSFVTLGADARTSVQVFELPAERRSGDSIFATIPTTQEQEPNAMNMEEMQQKVADLSAELSTGSAKLTAMTAERDEAVAKLAAFEADAKKLAESMRQEDVRAVHAELGKDISDAALAIYMGMPDDAWKQVRADLMASKPDANPALFGEQATNGRSVPGAEDAMLADARRRAEEATARRAMR